MGLAEQLGLEIWLFHTSPAIRTQHLLVWNEAQVTISAYFKAWLLNVFISFQDYILFIPFLFVLQPNIVIGHFYDHTDPSGYFYDNDWWAPILPLPSIYRFLIQDSVFKKQLKVEQRSAVAKAKSLTQKVMRNYQNSSSRTNREEPATSFSSCPVRHSEQNQSLKVSFRLSHSLTKYEEAKQKPFLQVMATSPPTAFTFPPCPCLPTQVRAMLKKLVIY